jgi:hypothetical protein
MASHEAKERGEYEGGVESGNHLKPQLIPDEEGEVENENEHRKEE